MKFSLLKNLLNFYDTSSFTSYMAQKQICMRNKLMTAYNNWFLFVKTYFLGQHFLITGIIFYFWDLNKNAIYYVILFLSLVLYGLLLVLGVNITQLIQQETTVKLEQPKYLETFLVFGFLVWFPLCIFLNFKFEITSQVWSFMLTLTTSYVWFFYGCFSFCYFTCAITYHFIMEGWHKHLYISALCGIVLLFWVYTLPYFVPDFLLGIKASNFIFQYTRYVFVAWSGLIYFVAWLWYRNYIQKAFFYYNKIPYTFSFGNLLFMFFLDLYFGIFNFSNWLCIWTTYPAIISWCLCAGFNFAHTTLNTNPLFKYFYVFIYTNIWTKIYPFWKKQLFYFFRKMSLFYWIWICHHIYFWLSSPLTTFKYWKLTVPFLVIFCCWMLCLFLFLSFFFLVTSQVSIHIWLQSLTKSKKYIYLNLPCLFIWVVAVCFFLWL